MPDDGGLSARVFVRARFDRWVRHRPAAAGMLHGRQLSERPGLPDHREHWVQRGSEPLRRALPDHRVRDRRDLRRERALRSEAVHRGLLVRSDHGLRAVASRRRPARLRSGELLRRRIRLRGRPSVCCNREQRRARVLPRFLHPGLHLPAELRLPPRVDRAPSVRSARVHERFQLRLRRVHLRSLRGSPLHLHVPAGVRRRTRPRVTGEPPGRASHEARSLRVRQNFPGT